MPLSNNTVSSRIDEMSCDVEDVTMEYHGELSELQNDDSIKALLKIKWTMMWLCEETQAKYPKFGKKTTVTIPIVIPSGMWT